MFHRNSRVHRNVAYALREIVITEPIKFRAGERGHPTVTRPVEKTQFVSDRDRRVLRDPWSVTR